MIPLKLRQKVIFVLGKGGTGRTSVALALASQAAQNGERVLLVQWALHDGVAPLLHFPPGDHTTRELTPRLFVMNYSFNDALREYFVSYLNMRPLFDSVIRNRQVQRLIHAIPGIEELFFLGRIFWQSELRGGNRSWSFDRIVVDAPASGHGVGLLSVPHDVAATGIVGPLSDESRRVANFIADAHKVATLLVALPEELPAQETGELAHRIQQRLGRVPDFIVINRTVSEDLVEECQRIRQIDLSEVVSHPESARALTLFMEDLGKRKKLENTLRAGLEAQGCPVVSIPELDFTSDFSIYANRLREDLQWG